MTLTALGKLGWQGGKEGDSAPCSAWEAIQKFPELSMLRLKTGTATPIEDPVESFNVESSANGEVPCIAIRIGLNGSPREIESDEMGPYFFSESLGRGSNTGYGITFAQIEGDRPVSIKHAAQKMGEEMFSKLRGNPQSVRLQWMTKEINKVRNELGGIKLELMHWLFVCALGDISADPLTCPKDIAESLDLLSINRTEGNVLPSYVYMSIRDQQPKRVRLLGGADAFEKVLGEWPSPPSGRTERDSVPLQERPHPLSGRIETRRKRWPTNAIIDVGLNDFVSVRGETGIGRIHGKSHDARRQTNCQWQTGSEAVRP